MYKVVKNFAFKLWNYRSKNRSDFVFLHTTIYSQSRIPLRDAATCNLSAAVLTIQFFLKYYFVIQDLIFPLSLNHGKRKLINLYSQKVLKKRKNLIQEESCAYYNMYQH